MKKNSNDLLTEIRLKLFTNKHILQLLINFLAQSIKFAHNFSNF